MSEFFVLLFYGLLFGGLIYKSQIFHLDFISKKKLVGLFYLKLLAGVAYIYISNYHIGGGDIFYYYKDSLVIFRHLLNGELGTYLHLTFGLNNVFVGADIATSVKAMGFWYDTSSYMIVRLNALINIATLGSGIYANSIFFSSLSFFASYLLVKLLTNVWETKKPYIAYALFLTPSVFFWTGGMHKESISVFLLSVVLLSFIKTLQDKKIVFVVPLLIGLGLLFCLRSFICYLIIVPMFAYGVHVFYNKWNALSIFLATFIGAGLLLYLLPLVVETPNLVDRVIEKKELYEALDYGNTAIPLGAYEVSYLGVVKKMPQALFNALVRPHFLDVNSLYLGLASVESFLLTIALLFSLYNFKYLSHKQRPFAYLLLSFSLCYLLLTGLIVPNLGAILRYRSIALFLLVPIIALLLERKGNLKS